MTGSAIAGLGTLLALMTAVWAASAARRDVSIVDVCWSLAVLAAAGVYASGADDMTLRRSVMLVAVFLWAIRLAGYLAWRGWGAAEDKRYRAKRARRPRFRWTSLFVVFWLQAVLAWIVALPLLAVMHVEEPGGPGLLDALGALLFLVGFGFEAAGDWQMARFKADPRTAAAWAASSCPWGTAGRSTRISTTASGARSSSTTSRGPRSWAHLAAICGPLADGTGSGIRRPCDMSRGRFRGAIGGGGPRVALHTASGVITDQVKPHRSCF